MAVEELVKHSIPLAEVLSHCASVPEILVELTICKASQLTEHIQDRVKDQQKC